MKAGLFVPFEGEIFTDESVTEPNQCLTISEIMSRYGMGMQVAVLDGAKYDDDSGDEFEDDPTRVADFDFADAYSLEEELRMRQAMQEHSEGLEKSNEKENVSSVNDVQTEEKSETKTDSVENS